MLPVARVLIIIALFLSWSAYANTAVQLEEKIKADPDNVSARVKLAEIRIEEKQFEKAAELLDAYTDLLSNAGFRALAFAYSNLKRYEDEVRVLTIISKKDEENFEWRMLLGSAYLKQAASLKKDEMEKNARLLTSGIQQLRMALKLSPKYRPAFDLLLRTLIEQKAHNEARELLMEGISSYGPRADLYKELCRLDSNDGFLVQAVNNCTESIKISPNYPDHQVYLIQALYDQKEEVKAEKQAISAAKKFPNSEFVQWAAGTMFFRKKNFPVAARYFKAAAKAKPGSGRAQFGLAQSLYEAGQHEEALEHFIAACKADRETVETFLSSGARLKQRGNTELGGKYTQAAYACKP